MNKLIFAIAAVFLILGGAALIIQSQTSPPPKVSPSPSSSSVTTSTSEPRSKINNDDNNIQNEQTELSQRETSPPETTKKPSSSSSSACPANRFTERYFTTDPLAIRFKELGYDGTKRLNENVQKVSSTKMHTGSGIPEAFKQLLYNQFTKDGEKVKVEENSDKYFSGEKAVDALEAKCGWDGIKGVFTKDPECLKEFVTSANGGEKKISQLKKFFESSSSSSSSDNEPDYASMPDEELLRVAPQLMDIVVPSIRDLDFLQDWRDIIEGFHLIFVQDGDPSKMLKIPPWVDYELYNRNDINDALKSKAWIISQKDASIRNFGFLVSKKKFIYTIDDDTFPVTVENGLANSVYGDSSSTSIRQLFKSSNPILMHLRNLLSPSTPFFMNTLYDGYRPGVDFVRGFPYSMRDGVSTVLSHGLWLNVPDYDAPTQLVKPQEKNSRHLDATLTVPAAVFYPMCSMNVAFDRKKIGAAFMQGLMGVGQPWARYDDMFAGWASKVVADHLAVGVKNGAPYIFHKKASNPFTNLKKEYKGLWWQEIVIAFCNRVQLPASANTAETAYRALAEAIRTELTPLHPYFDRLATAMNSWVDAWEDAEAGKLKFTPSRKSIPEERNLAVERDKVSCCSKRGAMNYKQRYSDCLSILKQPLSVRREIFRRATSLGREASKEAVLLHISEREQIAQRERRNATTKRPAKWSKDLYLHVCSVLLEASVVSSSESRDVFLLVASYENDVKYQNLLRIPKEFQHLVRFYQTPSTTTKKQKNDFIHGKPHEHTDLAVAHFLQQHPSYNFAWVIDSATRFVGDWNQLLMNARRPATHKDGESEEKILFGQNYNPRKTEDEFATEISENDQDDESLFYRSSTIVDEEVPYDNSHTRGNENDKVLDSMRRKQEETTSSLPANTENNKSTTTSTEENDNNSDGKNIKETLPRLFGLKTTDNHLIFASPILVVQNSSMKFIFATPLFGFSRTLANEILKQSDDDSSQETRLASVAIESRLKMKSLFFSSTTGTNHHHRQHVYYPQFPNTKVINPQQGQQNSLNVDTGDVVSQNGGRMMFPRNSYFESSAVYGAWRSNEKLNDANLFKTGVESSPLYENADEIVKGVLAKEMKYLKEKNDADGECCLKNYLIYPVRD